MNSLASVFIASSKFTFISSKGHPISMGFYTFFNIADFFLFIVVEAQPITLFSIHTFLMLLDLFPE